MPCGRWSRENFEIHHRENPEIYELFCRFSLEAAAVLPYFSAKEVYGRMRWFTLVEEKKSEYKLDDGWISHYARKFMRDYPQYNGFFRTRKVINGYHLDDDYDYVTPMN